MEGKHYFVIRNTFSEWSGGITEICDSFQEAVNKMPNHNDWYRDKNTGTIQEVTSTLVVIHEWDVEYGKISQRK